MSTLTVQVALANPGTVEVQVWTYTQTGPSFSWGARATPDRPINQTWDDLEPGAYAITISWNEGYHHIGSTVPGNKISYNGHDYYFSVLGNAEPGFDVIATFSLQLT